MSKIKNVALNAAGDAVEIIDQRLLPGETAILTLRTVNEVYDAIKTLAVRGAPAIGICAGYAYYTQAYRRLRDGRDLSDMPEVSEYLISARPTAVNLEWALKRMHACMLKNAALPKDALIETLRTEAERIRAEDAANNLKMSEYGLSLIKDGDGVLTHCNAGWLATSEYGTSLGPLHLSHERGMHIRVYADETRPLLQGARLTAWELYENGIDVTLICDNMANQVMKNGWVNAVFVGCDRAARNGDCANKIGTCGVAVLAKHYNIPMYFFVPSSTIDMNCKNGADIAIEQREGRELIDMWYERPMAPEHVKTYNPAFDVTENSLITGIVTEYGIIKPPFEEGFKKLFKEKERCLK